MKTRILSIMTLVAMVLGGGFVLHAANATGGDNPGPDCETQYITVIDTPAFDETVVDTPASDETVIDSPAVDQWWHWNDSDDPTGPPPGGHWGIDNGNHNGIDAPDNTVYNVSHGNNGRGSWFYHQVSAEVSHVVHHPAVTHIVHHPAVTHQEENPNYPCDTENPTPTETPTESSYPYEVDVCWTMSHTDGVENTYEFPQTRGCNTQPECEETLEFQYDTYWIRDAEDEEYLENLTTLNSPADDARLEPHDYYSTVVINEDECETETPTPTPTPTPTEPPTSEPPTSEPPVTEPPVTQPPAPTPPVHNPPKPPSDTPPTSIDAGLSNMPQDDSPGSHALYWLAGIISLFGITGGIGVIASRFGTGR